jgi:hypothetical protein
MPVIVSRISHSGINMWIWRDYRLVYAGVALYWMGLQVPFHKNAAAIVLQVEYKTVDFTDI